MPGATPLFDALRRHAQGRPVQFHIPGHKRGVGIDPAFAAFFGANGLAIDQINIGPLDDSHQPMGIIAQAQRLAAAAFGAEHTFFSVQGTSSLIMAMIMATCGPGDKLIVPRNVHKSVMAGLILSGARPVFIMPEMDGDGFVGNVTPGAYEAALAHHPDARAAFVIHPTYYGACTDLPAVVAAAHAQNIPVLVDEAHGAQYSFHPAFPPSAMAAGTDAAAVSMHKTGGSLTQSSLLNVQGTRLSPRRIQTVLNVLTTTSTSYLLLASLDAARRHMQQRGPALLERTLAAAHNARRMIEGIPGLRCRGWGVDNGRRALADRWDPTKLCIDVRGLGLSGRDVERLLREDHNIEVELSDLHHILCLFTLADGVEDDRTERPGEAGPGMALVTALAAIAANQRHRAGCAASTKWAFPRALVHTVALNPREAFFSATERLPLEAASGHISAEFITAYPPGIPTVIPGELVTDDDIADVRRCQALGCPIHGPEDPTLATLRVVIPRT